MFNNSLKKYAASMVAVTGCINKPIAPIELEIFPMPIVIKNWPPNWQKNANNKKFIQSYESSGIWMPDSIKPIGIEYKQQNNVV